MILSAPGSCICGHATGHRAPSSHTRSRAAIRAWLDDQELPVDAGAVKRQHIEAWLAHLLDRWSPGTAASRYWSLRQFFRWLEENGELAVSPKAKMRPAAGA